MEGDTYEVGGGTSKVEGGTSEVPPTTRPEQAKTVENRPSKSQPGGTRKDMILGMLHDHEIGLDSDIQKFT